MILKFLKNAFIEEVASGYGGIEGYLLLSLSKKLIKDKSLSKTYCSILKRFLNNKKFNASHHWNF